MKRTIASTDQWLEWRRENVGASEVAAVFGLHPYLTPLELWASKAGLIAPSRETAVMRRGKIMEAAVASAVALERPEWTLTKCTEYFSEPFGLGASPDYWIDRGNGPASQERGVLQCKTASPRSFEENFSDEQPPFWITLQTATELMLSGAAFGYCAVLQVDAWKDPLVRIFEIPKNVEAENRIAAGVIEFWDKLHKGEQPKADYARDAALFNALHPRETPGTAVDLSGDNELPILLEERALAMQTRKQTDDRITEIGGMLKEKLGAAENGTLPGWRIRWKVEPRAGYAVLPSEPRVLRINRVKEQESL